MAEILDLHNLQSQQQAIDAADTFIALAIPDGNIQKQVVFDLLNGIQSFLSDKSAKPRSKLATLFIIKNITERNQLKILSLLSSHQLLDFLFDKALNVDPKKGMGQKGRQLFPEDQKAGNQYMKLLLELFMYWGQKFQKNKKNEPTKYRKKFNELVKNKVIFPKQYAYLKNPKGLKKEGKRSSIGRQQPSYPAKQQKTYETEKPQSNKILSQLKFTINKIEGLINVLQDEQSVQVLDKQLRRYHEAFQRDNQKYTRVSEEVMSMGSQETMDKYFKVMEYINKQQQSFQKNFKKGDYQTHISCLFIAYQSIFPSEEGTKRQAKITSNRHYYQQQDNSHTNKQDQSSVIRQGDSEKENNYQIQLNNKRTSYESATGSKIQNNSYLKPISTNKQVQNNTKNAKVIQNIIDQLQSKSRSKSPLNGFLTIKNSIEKQRRQIQSHSKSRVLNRSRVKNDKPLSKISSASRMGVRPNYHSSLAKSKVDSIFLNPPNQNAPKNHYSGQLIPENRQLIKQIASVSKAQGHRRFKMGHFKQNYLLFQNQHLQVGFKSEMINQRVQNFIGVLGIQLFFGNKTGHTIADARLSFKSDESILLYTTNTDSSFQFYPGQQLRYEMAVIPKDLPFNYLNLSLSYCFQNDNRLVDIKIPTSITKLVKHYPVSRTKFEHFQRQQTIIKTDPFVLSHHFPPQKLMQTIPNLVELTDYQQFKKSNSRTDYVLIGSLSLLDQYEALMKIIVRPNLNVVIQIGMEHTNKRLAQNGFRFFMETLEGVLKQTEL